MTLHAARLVPQAHHLYAGGKDDAGHSHRRVVVAGDALDHGTDLGIIVHHSCLRAVLAQKVQVPGRAVALGAAGRHDGRIVLVPVDKGLGLRVGVARAHPQFGKGDLGHRLGRHFNLDHDLLFHNARHFDFFFDFDLYFLGDLDLDHDFPGHLDDLGLLLAPADDQRRDGQDGTQDCEFFDTMHGLPPRLHRPGR